MSTDEQAPAFHPKSEVVTPEPTQVKHPRQTTIRTAFQALVGLAVVVPVVVAETGLDASQVAWLAPVLGVCAIVARVMAIPQVDAWLEKVGLGANPKPQADTDPPEEYDDTEDEETP